MECNQKTKALQPPSRKSSPHRLTLRIIEYSVVLLCVYYNLFKITEMIWLRPTKRVMLHCCLLLGYCCCLVMYTLTFIIYVLCSHRIPSCPALPCIASNVKGMNVGAFFDFYSPEILRFLPHCLSRSMGVGRNKSSPTLGWHEKALCRYSSSLLEMPLKYCVECESAAS